MPPWAEIGLCSECLTSVTPGKRKCRAHRTICFTQTSPTRQSVPSTAHPPLQDQELNTLSTRRGRHLQSNLYFGSSIWHQPTPPSRYRYNNGEDGTGSHRVRLSAELQGAFSDHTARRRQLTRDQQQFETSPSHNRRRHPRFTVYTDSDSSTNSPSSTLPSISQIQRDLQLGRRPRTPFFYDIDRISSTEPSHRSNSTAASYHPPTSSDPSLDRPQRVRRPVRARRARILHPEPQPLQNNDPAQRPRQLLFREPQAWISSYSVQIQPHNLGLMNIQCPYCHALHWKVEAAKQDHGVPIFELCCKKGALQVEETSEIPEYLRALFEREHPLSVDFHKHIRQVNAALAMVSVNMKPNDRMNNTTGLKTFQLQGSIHHILGTSHVQPGTRPSYAQLYFLSPDDATTHRYDRNPNISRCLFELLTTQFDLHNSFARKYHRAAEALEYASTPHSQDRVTLNQRFIFQLESGRDKNRENLPSTNEVAAIIPGLAEQNWNPFREEILAIPRAHPIEITLATRRPPRTNESPLEWMNRRHPAYHPMAYPLLFPMGNQLYRQTEEINGRSRAAPCAQPRQFFFSRPRTFNPILHAGQLYQQFAVDIFACIDQDRLCYIRNHQKYLRADQYQQVQQDLNEGMNPNRLGKRIILPSSYTCGPRFMEQCYQDAITLVRHFGKPDLFITFTANPRWPEIQANLYPGQSANDRPELTVRVTRLKFKAFLYEILKNEIFGKVNGHVYTNEYQKRGLPHFHLLLFLNHNQRSYEGMLTPEYIDNIILAELPSPQIDPDGSLAKIVGSCMLHRDCGPNHPTASCMRDGRCEKRFPKAFQETTFISTEGYPTYRRRQDTPYIKEGHVELSGDLNGRIVPYNPYLTRRYNCHINVELCANVNAIRYIFKYIFKGHDLTHITITQQNETSEDSHHPRGLRQSRRSRHAPNITEPSESVDEIKCYHEARYLSPCEALWRLFEYPVREQSPPVITLHVHLPGENPVSWEEGLTVEELQRKADERDSTLMGFFKWNLNKARNAQQAGRAYNRDEGDLYLHFPETHVWVPSQRRWKLRERGTALGRVQQSTPQQGERWYVRRLLMAIRGPTSFNDLRTVDGVEYPTFQEACQVLGLVEDDSEWRQCFTESRTFRTGEALRGLFTIALEYGPPVDSLALWNEFREWICDDLPRRIEVWRAQGLLLAISVDTPDLHYDLGLYEIRQRLKEFGKDLSHFQLPEPQQAWDQHIGNPLIQQQRNYDTGHEQQMINQLQQRLNQNQRSAYDAIIHSLETTSEDCRFFIQGPAGTGKTFLYHCLCHYLRAQSKIVLCVASSGIAALLLPGGTTAHSRFKIPLNVEPNSHCNITATSQLAALLSETSLIIWDEAPMTHRYCYDAVDRTLRDIREKPDVPFGGIPVVFGGDFAQILPVVPGGNRAKTVDATLQRSMVFPTCMVKRLTQNMRLQQGNDNLDFANWIRNMSYFNHLIGSIRLPSYIPRATGEDDLSSTLYPTFPGDPDTQVDFYKDRAILAVVNNDINRWNDKILGQFLQAHPQPAPRRYYALDTLDNDEQGQGINVPVEILNAMSPDGLPPFELQLKPGVPILLLRNLDSSKGLANGSRLILTRAHPYVLEARLLGGDFHGQPRLIPRIPMTTKTDHFPRFTRKQFPVKLCFAMTIHKSQGQSLKNVGVDLRRPCFTHGQLYVALSRVTDVSRLKILLNIPQSDVHNRNDVYDNLPHDISYDVTENVVYPEALLQE